MIKFAQNKIFQRTFTQIYCGSPCIHVRNQNIKIKPWLLRYIVYLDISVISNIEYLIIKICDRVDEYFTVQLGVLLHVCSTLQFDQSPCVRHQGLPGGVQLQRPSGRYLELHDQTLWCTPSRTTWWSTATTPFQQVYRAT